MAAAGLAVIMRALVVGAFTPAFIYSDGPAYLAFVGDLTVSPDRPVGYGVYLQLLAWLDDGVWLVALTQHLMGLAVAAILYLLLLRYGVSSLVATLAVVPVLFDSMQLVVEHSVLSDPMFELLLVAGVAVLAWRPRPTVSRAALAGLVLGLSVLVRLAAQPVVLAALVFCLLAGGVWSRRIPVLLALTACFVAPLGVYAAWYHHERGVYALAEIGGRALYMRTTTFVDCDKLELPAYERTLCPREPVGDRLDPTAYLWHDPRTMHALIVPAGETQDTVARDFAMRAISAQPLDYARVAARDFVMNFAWTRSDNFEYNTAHKWGFADYVDYKATSWTGPAFDEHGGTRLQSRQPWADLLVKYGQIVNLWGPVLLGCLLAGVAGAIRPARGPGSAGRRNLTVLLVLLGAGLMAVPDLAAAFVWRYQLPAVVLLPAAAALAWTSWRLDRSYGTRATPSTD